MQRGNKVVALEVSAIEGMSALDSVDAHGAYIDLNTCGTRAIWQAIAVTAKIPVANSRWVPRLLAPERRRPSPFSGRIGTFCELRQAQGEQ